MRSGMCCLATDVTATKSTPTPGRNPHSNRPDQTPRLAVSACEPLTLAGARCEPLSFSHPKQPHTQCRIIYLQVRVRAAATLRGWGYTEARSSSSPPLPLLSASRDSPHPIPHRKLNAFGFLLFTGCVFMQDCAPLYSSVPVLESMVLVGTPT